MNDRMKYRFLVADDDSISRTIMSIVLAPFAESVDVVNDGEAVLLAVAEKDYDFIFMDVHMPLLDGIETTKALRSVVPSTRLPIIVAITASSDSLTLNRCFAAGMKAHISKPLDSGDLTLLIENWKDHTPSAKLHASGEDDTDLLNMKRIRELKELERSAATEAVIADLISMFRSEFPVQLANLRAALQTHDHEKIAKISHKLKGSLLNLGLSAAAAACDRFKHVQYISDDAVYLELIDRLEELYNRSFEEFSLYLRSA